jgi:NAD(P)-dependent dehydrogenase (short-subunit alcohol dehydrogenase family)
MAKVLVTGANGGFGMLVVEALTARGHVVAASARDLDGRNRDAVGELRRLGATVVGIDVTDDASVERGVREAEETVGGLDVVVHNAGVGVVGIQEAFTPEDWRRLFEVNVFGVQRVNRAVLPGMRSRRSGLLVHVSSLLGRMVLPFYGPYCASKWALEAMAEGSRVELSAFGVDVVIVEPGGYPTSFHGKLMRPSDAGRNPSYGTMPEEAEQALRGFEAALAANPAQDPRDVAAAVLEVIERPAGARPFRTVVDRMGMGEAIRPYNEQLATLTLGIYGAFGLADRLKLRSGT